MSTPPMGYANDIGSGSAPDSDHSSNTSVYYDLAELLPYPVDTHPLAPPNPNAYQEQYVFPGNVAIPRGPDPGVRYSTPMVGHLVP